MDTDWCVVCDRHLDDEAVPRFDDDEQPHAPSAMFFLGDDEDDGDDNENARHHRSAPEHSYDSAASWCTASSSASSLYCSEACRLRDTHAGAAAASVPAATLSSVWPVRGPPPPEPSARSRSRSNNDYTIASRRYFVASPAAFDPANDAALNDSAAARRSALKSPSHDRSAAPYGRRTTSPRPPHPTLAGGSSGAESGADSACAADLAAAIAAQLPSVPRACMQLQPTAVAAAASSGWALPSLLRRLVA